MRRHARAHRLRRRHGGGRRVPTTAQVLVEVDCLAMLRTILQRIFVAVREAANGLEEFWGPDARDMPGYREALIDIAVA